MLRKITAVLLVVAAFSVQSTFGVVFSGVPAVPNLLLILTCYIGFTAERMNGMVTGLAAGFLMDVCFANTLGPYMLLYSVIGYVSGFFRDIFYLEDIMWPIAWLAISDFAYNFVIYIVRFLLLNRLDFVGYLTKAILPELVVTVITGILLYWPILKWNQLFDRFEDRSIKDLD